MEKLPYSIYDILVIICMVIIVQSYIIVNFGYKIVSYKISVIFLDIIFFPLYYSRPPSVPCITAKLVELIHAQSPELM